MWPRLCIFDLDGTLVDSAVGVCAALNEIRRKRGGSDLTPAEVAPMVAMGASSLMERALGPMLIQIEDDLAKFRAIYGMWCGSPSDLYTDVVEILETLRIRGTILAVCTNKPQLLAEKVLADCGIADKFAIVVGGDAVPNCKPDPAHLSVILDRFSCSPDQAVLVGDSDVDAAAAYGANVDFIFAAWGYGHCSQMSNMVLSIDELPYMLNQMATKME